MDSGIYEIINLANGKSYVGSTVNLDKRYTEHFGALSKNKHTNSKLQNSYNKYGKNNFIFEVLLYCDKDELLEYEDYFIREFKPELNLQSGAVRRIGDWKPSDESRIKMSESRKNHSGPNKGSTLSSTRKKQLRDVNFGNSNASKLFNVRIQAPDGKIYSDIRNLLGFCREQGIRSPATFYMFVMGQRNKYKDWRLL